MRFVSKRNIPASRANTAIVCLLSAVQEEGDDQALNLPETIQVSWRSSARIRYPMLIAESRVGDIVDIKANGAVQKG